MRICGFKNLGTDFLIFKPCSEVFNVFGQQKTRPAILQLQGGRIIVIMAKARQATNLTCEYMRFTLTHSP